MRLYLFFITLLIIIISIGIKLWTIIKGNSNAMDWKTAYKNAIENDPYKGFDYELKWPIKGEYKEKGSFIQADGLKTYHVGSDSADKGILIIYDIYGFKSNTLQGADILAQWPYTAPKQYYQVFMPDFFEGNYMDPAWQAPGAPAEEAAKAGKWWGEVGGPGWQKNAPERIPAIMDDLKKKYPKIKSWGVLGFCWGGKVVSLVAQNSTLFKTAATAHPALPFPGAANGVKIPLLVLPTIGEKADVLDPWVKDLKVKHEVLRFEDQEHGFMAAKGNLKDPKVADGYWKGYVRILYWFYETLGFEIPLDSI